jgi:single-strand DNA-binding protein
MISLQLIGNIGNDAIVRETNGKFSINFSVGRTERYQKNDGQVVEKTTWVNCVIWKDNKSKISDYLKKGTKVFCSGIPSVNTYKNKDNVTVAELLMNVNHVELLSSKIENGV